MIPYGDGTPKGTRTPDLLIRSQSLYPTELSPHMRIPQRQDIIAQSSQKCKPFFKNFSKIFIFLFYELLTFQKRQIPQEQQRL